MLFKILGRFAVGLAFAFLFLALGALSGLGGWDNIFYMLMWIALVSGLLWGMAAPFESECDIPGPQTKPATLTNQSKVKVDNGTVSALEEKQLAQQYSMLFASQPILEAADIQKFIATASKNQIRKACADRVSASRFFNAIRYGEIAMARKTLSASPLLILAKDAYGNTPIEAAAQEKNTELQDFFKNCLRSHEA
jgi:hypothetical protein